MGRVRIATVAGLAVLAPLAIGLYAVAARAADPDALWKIVHGRCVPGSAAGDPAPCVAVTADWAVLKDFVGATQFLLIPTARVTGIESPAVLDPAAPNYFAAAWQAHRFIDERTGHPIPRDDIALAINSPGARSQEQLHIHVDCVRADVRDALGRLPLTEAWSVLPDPLAGQRYSARQLATRDLDANPFQLLAKELPGAAVAMGQYTLAVVGSRDGFILLAGRIGEDGRGHGEDLQDHGCALAHGD